MTDDLEYQIASRIENKSLEDAYDTCSVLLLKYSFDCSYTRLICIFRIMKRAFSIAEKEYKKLIENDAILFSVLDAGNSDRIPIEQSDDGNFSSQLLRYIYLLCNYYDRRIDANKLYMILQCCENPSPESFQNAIICVDNEMYAYTLICFNDILRYGYKSNLTEMIATTGVHVNEAILDLATKVVIREDIKMVIARTKEVVPAYRAFVTETVQERSVKSIIGALLEINTTEHIEWEYSKKTLLPKGARNSIEYVQCIVFPFMYGNNKNYYNINRLVDKNRVGNHGVVLDEYFAAIHLAVALKLTNPIIFDLGDGFDYWYYNFLRLLKRTRLYVPEKSLVLTLLHYYDVDQKTISSVPNSFSRAYLEQSMQVVHAYPSYVNSNYKNNIELHTMHVRDIVKAVGASLDEIDSKIDIEHVASECISLGFLYNIAGYNKILVKVMSYIVLTSSDKKTINFYINKLLDMFVGCEDEQLRAGALVFSPVIDATPTETVSFPGARYIETLGTMMSGDWAPVRMQEYARVGFPKNIRLVPVMIAEVYASKPIGSFIIRKNNKNMIELFNKTDNALGFKDMVREEFRKIIFPAYRNEIGWDNQALVYFVIVLCGGIVWDRALFAKMLDTLDVDVARMEIPHEISQNPFANLEFAFQLEYLGKKKTQRPVLYSTEIVEEEYLPLKKQDIEVVNEINDSIVSRVVSFSFINNVLFVICVIICILFMIYVVCLIFEIPLNIAGIVRVQ